MVKSRGPRLSQILFAIWLSMFIHQGYVYPHPGGVNVNKTASKAPPHITEVQAINLDGSPFLGASLKGKVILLDFWAVWCGPCLKAFPDLVKLNRDLAGQNFEVISIASYSGTAQDVLPVVEQYAIDYRVLIGDPTLVERFGVIGFPTYFLMGPDGTLVKKYVGEVAQLYDRVKNDVRAIQSEPSITVDTAASQEGGH